MSLKCNLDKTMTALENVKNKTVKVFQFVRGLSVRNKMTFDVSVKSDRAVMPIWKRSFGYNKEIRVMSAILIMAGVLAAMFAVMGIGKNCKK